jgi:hypothetical protein
VKRGGIEEGRGGWEVGLGGGSEAKAARRRGGRRRLEGRGKKEKGESWETYMQENLHDIDRNKQLLIDEGACALNISKKSTKSGEESCIHFRRPTYKIRVR